MTFKKTTPLKNTKIKFMAVCAVLFAFGVATSSVATAAWYNMIDIAIIGSLNMRVNLDENAWLKLQLLDNDGNPVEDLEGDGYTKEQLGIEGKALGQVSGMYQDDWYNEETKLNENLLPQFRRNYRPRINEKPSLATQDDEGNFYVQNVFEFTAGREMDIYLSENTGIAPNHEKNVEAEANSNGELHADRLDNVVNAVRYSFLTNEQYIVCKPADIKGDSEQTYFGGILDLDKDGYYDYDEDNKEILYGEYESTPNYVELDVEEPNESFKDNKNTFIANHAEGIKQVEFVNQDRSVFLDTNNKQIEIKKEESYSLNSLAFDQVNYLAKKLTPICHIDEGETKRIVISIYVEGWDVDMTDEIASASFDVDISFTGIID